MRTHTHNMQVIHGNNFTFLNKLWRSEAGQSRKSALWVCAGKENYPGQNHCRLFNLYLQYALLPKGYVPFNHVIIAG
jgi:hypothetical protein